MKRNESISNPAKKLRERIERDRVKAPLGLQPVFERIAAGLSEPELRAADLAARFVGSSEDLPQLFREAAGCFPIAYLRARRMEYGSELLRETSWPVWQIAAEAGFGSDRAFRRSFKREHGVSPEAWRRMESAEECRSKVDGQKSIRSWRRFLQGTLARSKASRRLDQLRGYVERGTLSSEASGSSRDSGLVGENEERIVAEALWEAVRARPDSECLGTLRSWAKWFETVTLSEHLLNRSRIEGRGHPQRSVRIAQLAIESLKPLAGRVDKDSFRLATARCLAWLGNARRQCGDLHTAREEIEKAKDLLQASSGASNVLPEVSFLECQLLICERNLQEALEVSERVLVAASDSMSSTMRAQILVARGTAAWRAGFVDLAIESYQEAILHLADGNERYLLLTAHHNLATGFLAADDLKKAEESLRQAMRLAADIEGPVPTQHLLWTEALLDHRQGNLERAEAHYLAARGMFKESQDIGHFAVISLDLAALYAERSKHAEVLQVLHAALPNLKALRLDPDALAAFKIIRDSVDAKQLSALNIKALRNHLTHELGIPPL